MSADDTFDFVDMNAAFPCAYRLPLTGGMQLQPGLTKRELFAAMAMQGLCSNSIAGRHRFPPQLTREAVAYADALIAELAKDAKS